MTENSENVWYSQVPYLRAVEDPTNLLPMRTELEL